MLNFLRQGAAMAIEDAMVLARCLDPDKYDNRAHRNDEDMGLFYYDAMTVPV